MTESRKKKKSTVVVFFGALFAIEIVMLTVNYRSMFVQELTGPKARPRELSTYGNQLILISQNGDIYTWDWNDLSGQPQVGAVKAQKATAIGPDHLVLMPFVENALFVLSNLKGDKEIKQLPLGIKGRCKYLKPSPNGKYIAAAFVVEGGPDNDIQLAVADADLTSVSKLIMSDSQGDKFTPLDIGVSDNGSLVAVVGGKDTGKIFVADAQSGQILWEQTIAKSSELNNVIFSPDGRIIYASESGRYVYLFDSATGEIIRQLEIDAYKAPPNNPQTISSLAISPDGHLLAAASVPVSRVWIWDAESGAKHAVIHTGQFTTSGISFSPDRSLLATADPSSSPVKIWRISKNH